MLEALNVDQAANPEMLLIHVREAIDDFVAEAPQFDDITMLAFEYLGPKEDT
jgi:sigma-B regulation protein RsbU (phosphoserine phosphatase)